MTQGRDRTMIYGLVTIAVIVALLAISFSGGPGSLFGGGPERQVVAEFTNTGQLRAGDEVRIGGIKVGKVESVELAANGRTSLVTMDIDDAGGPLHRDASATLRWRTLLGQAFYVSLERGSGAAGELEDHVIPAERTTTQVEVDDVASVVRGPARTGLRALPGALGDGLEDAEGTANTLHALQAVSPALERSARALQGQVPGSDLQQLVDGTARVVEELGSDDERLEALVRDGAITLQTTASRADAIREALDVAPGAMDEARVTLARLRTTLGLAQPLVEDLHRAAPDVRTTFAELRPVIVSADRLLANATPLLRYLDPSARALAGVARAGAPVLEDLTPTVSRLARDIVPAFARKWPETGISTTVMAGAALAGLGGIAAQRDANGHFVRFPLTAGSGSAYLPCQAFPNNPDFTPAQQIQCQNLSDTLEQVLSYEPLAPPPGAQDPSRKSKR